MPAVEGYKIAVPDSKLETLRTKLALTEFPDELDAAGWSYGAPLADVKRLHNHWLNSFDWRAQEQKLNDALPQYTTDVSVDRFGSLKIHFIHQKSANARAIPLLFCHGWPGSFIEVLKILPELVKGGKDFPAFHVVAPSLPNYGFSEGVTKKGFAGPQYAETCHKLMLQLGYSTYVTQGGDWGFFITRLMGILHPTACLASHLNMPAFPPPTPSTPSAYRRSLLPHTPSERAGLARSKWFETEGFGYNKTQSTKPQTIGYSQADSPVGLLAWIYEKLHDWTDGYAWTDDEVLTWVSIYWFSAAGPAAASRIYYEVAHDRSMRGRLREYRPGVKLGVARFPKELTITPRAWARAVGPVVFESEYEKGGHFAAWERPDAVVGDLRTMFGRRGGAYGVVRGKDGYEAGHSAKL